MSEAATPNPRKPSNPFAGVWEMVEDLAKKLKYPHDITNLLSEATKSPPLQGKPMSEIVAAAERALRNNVTADNIELNMGHIVHAWRSNFADGVIETARVRGYTDNIVELWSQAIEHNPFADKHPRDIAMAITKCLDTNSREKITLEQIGSALSGVTTATTSTVRKTHFPEVVAGLMKNAVPAKPGMIKRRWQEATDAGKSTAMMWGLGIVMGVTGFLNSLRGATAVDPEGKSHIVWSNVGVALAEAALAAGCTYMAWSALKPGTAR